MKQKPILALLIGLIVFASCGHGDRKFTILGDIAGMPVQTVILEQISANDMISIVDSEKSDNSGHFSISGIAPEAGLYRLHFSNNRYILLCIDKGNMKLTTTWKTFENYTIDGSAGSENLRQYIVGIREHLRDIKSVYVAIDTFRARGNDSMLAVAKKDYEQRERDFTAFVEKYCDTVSFEPNSIYAARMVNGPAEMNYLENYALKLNKRFPGTKMTREYGEYFAKLTAKIHAAKQAPSGHVDAGVAAPELTLPKPDGTMVSLSSFKGKYVLVDFWASWCGPCRKENPKVVAAYKKFKDKNFTILGVSLDNKKPDWEKAIADDGLAWTQVSDLRGWSSDAARIYGVEAIPTNFLVDPDGKIISRNLRGDELSDMLGVIFEGKK